MSTSVSEQNNTAEMSSQIEQNWNNGVCRRFQIPSTDHPEEYHEDMVYSIHLRGQYLVSGSKDMTVRIWNVDTQRLLRPPLRAHEASVVCVRFDSDPEQDVVISGGTDCSFIVWRFSTGEILHKAEHAHEETILSLCFDEKHIITGSKDKLVKVWNRQDLNHDSQVVSAYSELRTLAGHSAAVNSVKIRGNIIVTGGGDRTIYVWDVHTGERLRTILGHDRGVASLQYDGRFITSASSDRTVRIFDLTQPQDQAQVACFEAHSELVRAVQVRSSGVESRPDRIVTGSYDKTVKMWQHDTTSNTWVSTQTLAPLKDRTKDTNKVFSVQLNERRLVCCTQSKVITGWDFASSEDDAKM